jgi:glycerophosphoryl diester phosphodiesterase
VHPFVVSLASSAAREGIARAHEQNLAVNAWTVNSERQIARLAAAGIDAVITDVPDVARRVLDAAGGR